MNIFQSMRAHAAFWPAVAMSACSPVVELGSNADDASTAATGATTAGAGGAAGSGGTEGTGGLAGTGDDAGQGAAGSVACPVPGGRTPVVADTDAGAVTDGTADEGGVQVTPACTGLGLNAVTRKNDPACIPHFVDQHSFVRRADLLTDGRSTAKLKYTPGTPGMPESFCMSGRADSGSDPLGTAFVYISLTESEGGEKAPFDLLARRISRIRFNLAQDRPVTGVHVAITAGPVLDHYDASQFFDLLKGETDYAHPNAVACPGTTTAALSDFTPRVHALPSVPHVNHAFDPTLFTGIIFAIQPLANESFDYSFCVHDLAFLDANDREVTP
jgi:hypothetical protein